MKLIVVGNGIAGVSTARYVAERNADVEITLYSKEPHLYYPRPRLIDFLAGKLQLQDLPQYDRSWYERRGIRLVLGCQVKALDTQAHELELGTGERVKFDRCVLATGATSWVPPIPGTDLPGVYTLRTLDNAQTLREHALAARHVVVIGGGLLGLDAAGALAELGIDITVVEAQPWLLPRQIDEQGATLLQNLLEKKGIRFIVGDICARIEGEGNAVQRIRLRSGRILEADLVLIAIGVRSKIELAKQAGLDCQRGIVVDEYLRSSHPHVYAVGDAIEFNGRVWAIIPAALAQARVAAAHIVGEEGTRYHDFVPSTTLKVTGIDLVSLGEATSDDERYTILREVALADGIYKKLVLEDGHIVGAILIGDRSDAGPIQRLMRQGTDISPYLSRVFEPGTLRDLSKMEA